MIEHCIVDTSPEGIAKRLGNNRWRWKDETIADGCWFESNLSHPQLNGEKNMEFKQDIVGCCGLTGFQRVGQHKSYKTFIEGFIKAINYEYMGTRNTTFRRIRGSQVIVTTTQGQLTTNKFLQDFGFKTVSEERNSNSGNIVNLWVMEREEFNRKLEAELKKIPEIGPSPLEKKLVKELDHCRERHHYWCNRYTNGEMKAYRWCVYWGRKRAAVSRLLQRERANA